MSGLEKAGYVDIRKGYVGGRPRTWLRLSRRGRAAFAAHVAAAEPARPGGLRRARAALQAIADGAPARPGLSEAPSATPS